MSKKVFFKPKKVAVAVAASLFVSVAATAAIVELVKDNVFVDAFGTFGDKGAVTYIYPVPVSAYSADFNGFLVIDADEDVVPPGIAAYLDGYTSGDTTFNGCIMASKEVPITGEFRPCGLGPDSGKRFKLRTSKVNQPIDIVFKISAGANQVEDVLHYNVFGKLTNDSGVSATGYKIEIGTGVGAAFVASTTVDGLELLNGSGFVGKFPGGLFGGSPAEGLPFFSTAAAEFGFTQSGDVLTTTGMPKPYSDLFGAWQTQALVPVAWFLDIDGRAWTDDKIVAYQSGNDWFTYLKKWSLQPEQIGTLLGDFGTGIDLTPLVPGGALEHLNPMVNPYVDMNELTDWLNEEKLAAGIGGPEFASQKVVVQVMQFLTLERASVAATTIANYESSPSTIRFSDEFVGSFPTRDQAATWPVVATFKPDCGEDGLYILDAAYVNNAAFTGKTEVDPAVGCGTGVTADDMATVVNDNTNLEGGTDYFFGIPGFTQGVIEDLSNVNLFYEIKQYKGTPLTDFTMRITVTDTDPVTPPPPPPSSGGGGCAIGGDGRFDPTLPALAAAGLVFFGLRRFKASK
jgi:hypothetical protein